MALQYGMFERRGKRPVIVAARSDTLGRFCPERRSGSEARAVIDSFDLGGTKRGPAVVE